MTRPACSARAQEQRELVARQRPDLAVEAHLARAAVDLQPAEAQQVGLGRTWPTPQDGSQAGKQLARLEGLGQIVVGPQLETDDAVHGVSARGQHQDRHVAARADLAAHIEPVHVGQHQVEDDRVEGVARLQGEPGRAGPGALDAKSRPAEIVADHLGKAGVVLDQQDAVGHRRILAATPAVPEAPALPQFGQAAVDLAPLLGRKHLGNVAEGLREALAGSIGERHLLDPERLDRGPVDAWLGQQHPPALPRGLHLLAHRQQVLDGALDDGAQLLLLLVGRVDLDGQMPYAAVGAVLDARRVERPAHEARAVPMLLADGARGDRAGQAPPQALSW